MEPSVETSGLGSNGRGRPGANPLRSADDPVGRLLKIEAVCELVGLSRATVYRCIKDSEKPFPKPVKIGACSRWSERQVIDWKKALVAG